ncbi:MAG: hypothetical protein M3Z05_22345 [Gemmatimonadota bacterium]|nr:hypothetical protein [Gemmatimonadota bacterium]
MSFRSFRSPRARCTLVLALLTAACAGDVTAPTPLAASYKLSLYNGAVLPVGLRNIVAISPTGGVVFNCAERLVNATLVIDVAGTAVATRTSCDDGRPDVVRTLSSMGTVSATGDTTRIAYAATSTSFSYRTFARRSGTGLLIFRTEIDRPLILSTGSPAATTIEYDSTQRLYVPNP